MRIYDVITIFQDNDYEDGNLGLVMVHVQDVKNTSAYQISKRCLNPLLKHYKFRFQESNGRHTVILFPALTSLSCLSSFLYGTTSLEP